MKTKLIPNRKKPEPPLTFPVLAKYVHSKSVVLFTGPTTGVYLVSAAGDNVGEKSDSFAPVTRTNLWEILPPGTKIEF